MNVLGVIPARGGSKGVPRKNLRIVAGRPLLAWSIDAGRCRTIDRLVVSTEDPEIADAAIEMGAEILQRPAELATDEALSDPVLIHAVETLEGRGGYRPDYVVLLQPTVPVRRRGLVDDCVERLIDTGSDCLLTAYPLHFVWWQDYGWPEGQGGRRDHVWHSRLEARCRRQDADPGSRFWHEDGAVYVTRTERLRATQSRVCGRVEIFPTEHTIDIDSERDLYVASAMLAADHAYQEHAFLRGIE